jgi:hypothetical protein
LTVPSVNSQQSPEPGTSGARSRALELAAEIRKVRAEVKEALKIRTGSIFRRSAAKARKEVTPDDLTSRLKRVERAVELSYVGSHQAEIQAIEQCPEIQKNPKMALALPSTTLAELDPAPTAKPDVA